MRIRIKHPIVYFASFSLCVGVAIFANCKLRSTSNTLRPAITRQDIQGEWHHVCHDDNSNVSLVFLKDGTFHQAVNRAGSLRVVGTSAGTWTFDGTTILMDRLLAYEAGRWVPTFEWWETSRTEEKSSEVVIRGGAVPDPDEYEMIHKVP